MNMFRRFKILLVSLAGFAVFGVLPAKAMCPVCVVAVGAGLGLSRWFGVSDLVSGVWVGGLLMSMTMWTINWMKAKKVKFQFAKIIVFAAWYGMTIIPLYMTGVMGHPYNIFGGVDKLLFGIVVGTLAFYGGAKWYMALKKKNNGKPHFRFEKIAITMGALVAASLVLWLLGR